jgi:serine/threonine-protein kinase
MRSTGEVARLARGHALAIQEKATSLTIGARFGAYEIVSHHGSGGMADIWVARKISAVSSSDATPESSGRRFAIKTLLKRQLHHAEYVERFAQETELHRHLDHPNIVRFLETDVEGGARYMVLDFVEGMNLRQMLYAAKPRQLPLGVVYNVMASVCDALQYLHDLEGDEGPLGLVHGDVSPENVMIGLDGQVKLIDFGVATSTLTSPSGPSSAVLETSVLRPGRHVPPGRLQYLAPERVQGRGLDRRSDIYSVGAMLFELVYGVRPFQADTIYELLTKICQGTTVGADPGVDLETRDLIEHAMAVSPDERIDTAQHLSEALRLLRELAFPDEHTVSAFVRRLFGLAEPEEAEEIDLLWTEERATSEFLCLDSPSDTPLLEEGTTLDVRVRELLQQSSRPPMKSEPSGVELPNHAPAVPPSDAPEKKSRPPVLPDLFAPVARPSVPALDLFDTYGKRSRARASQSPASQSPTSQTPASRAPASGTFLAPRENGRAVPGEASVKPARVAATHFETGWHLLREGKADQTLAEWEAAMQLDPDNRSYAVNVQKLRLKLQR